MGWLFGKKEAVEKEKVAAEPKKAPTHKEVLFKLEQSKQYVTVSISRCGCAEASRLIGKSFSFSDVPLLPLTGCTASQCTCEYQGFSEQRHMDRRSGERREALRMEDDRRKNHGRRKADSLWDNNIF